jgi:hypothetical protein
MGRLRAVLLIAQRSTATTSSRVPPIGTFFFRLHLILFVCKMIAGGNHSAMEIVSARAPTDGGEEISVIVHTEHLRIILETGRLAALGELGGLIFGDQILLQPVRIFKGLRRPLLREGVDDFVFAYVSKPSVTYKFPLRPRIDQKPDVLLPPTDAVFVTFVTLSRDVVHEVAMKEGIDSGRCRGVILGWEWTCADPNDGSLPENHGNRYRRSVWPC